MANISKWFGYPIYITKLENFEEINKTIVPIILNDITPTNSQYSRTTDTHHQKFVVADRNIAVLEGVDWTVA